MREARVSRPLLAFLAVAWIGALPAAAPAHEIPSEVTVRAFLKPVGNRLHLLVRVPLKAMRDVEFPKREPGFLDLGRADASLRDAATMWISENVELYEGDIRLRDPRIVEVRASLPSDGSFASYEEAVAHIAGKRLPHETDLFWDQGLLDASLDYPIQSDRSDFAIRSGLDRLGLRVSTVLKFLTRGGDVRAFEFHGDPGLVRLDPRWHYAALRFVESGFFHILDGTDHLLFLLCLVIPFRRLRTLVVIVTAFTVAHSFTLIAAARNLVPGALWFPPLIETLIAISIVYMALENIVGSNAQRRWMIAFAFGLVHGFGFSFALRESLQFAGSHLWTSLLSFNVGVELGQILVLLLLIPTLELLFRWVAERIGTIILSALVAHTAWHWMIDRADRLSQFHRPFFDPGMLAMAMRGLMIALTLGGLFWLLSSLMRQRAERDARQKSMRE